MNRSDEYRLAPEGAIRMSLTQFNDTWKMTIEDVLYPDQLNDAAKGKDMLLRFSVRRLLKALMFHANNTEPATRFLLKMECFSYTQSHEDDLWKSASARLDNKDPSQSWLDVRVAADAQVLLLYHTLTGETFPPAAENKKAELSEVDNPAGREYGR